MLVSELFLLLALAELPGIVEIANVGISRAISPTSADRARRHDAARAEEGHMTLPHNTSTTLGGRSASAVRGYAGGGEGEGTQSTARRACTSADYPTKSLMC